MTLKRVCVFCGSRFGAKPQYKEAARDLGRVLVKKQLGLVYGGGTVGLMGEIARTGEQAWAYGRMVEGRGGPCVSAGVAMTLLWAGTGTIN